MASSSFHNRLFIMNSSFFKLIAVACTTAILAACGGGGSASQAASGPGAQPAPVLPPVPFASPAMIVPPGEASKTIALTNCGGGFQNVSLVVNAAGDMILNGAPSGTTTVSELQRIDYADAYYKFIDGVNSVDGPRAFVMLDNVVGYIRASTYQAGSFSAEKRSAPYHNFSCSLADGSTSFALTSLPSSQRYASLLTNGITGIDNTEVASGTFTGGVATWDNVASGSALPIDDQPIRYASLDINSAAIATSASPTGTFASLPITLPTTPTSTYAYFYEEFDDGQRNLFLRFARGSALQDFALYVERIGNLLKPYPQLNKYQ
jgi:hypothetical protein